MGRRLLTAPKRGLSTAPKRGLSTAVKRGLLDALGLAGLFGVVALAPASAQADEARAVVKIGSKRFTESFILAEIGGALLRTGGDAEVRHVAGLGGTAVTFR